MDIVLPLLEADLDRYLRLQRPTFERFYADLDRTTIVVRRRERRNIERATRHLRNVVLIDEQQLVPELALAKLSRNRVMGPWYRQQLIKLAAVAAAGTRFVLVLDADVLAVRALSDVDLVQDGRAIRPKEPAAVHPTWIAQAARALKLPALDYSATVTPSVLARDAVRSLAEYAEEHVRPDHAALRFAGYVPLFGRSLKTWRGRLLSVLPWTEYQLYDTFLVGTGQFDKFHRYSEDPVLAANGVWDRDQFDTWQLGPEGDGRTHFFTVVQSFIGLDTDEVLARLRSAHVLEETDTDR